jgi:hypothetical protein
MILPLLMYASRLVFLLANPKNPEYTGIMVTIMEGTLSEHDKDLPQC